MDVHPAAAKPSHGAPSLVACEPTEVPASHAGDEASYRERSGATR